MTQSTPILNTFSSSLLLVLLVSFNACTKKGGENNGLLNVNKQKFDIMSTKKGSWWLYKAEDGAVFYRYATGRDTLQSGLTFDYFYRIDTTSVMKEEIPEFFGKNDGKYISLIDVDGSFTNYITYVILKEGAFTGQTWNNTERKKIEGFNLDMLIESKVVNANETIVVQGKTYEGVVHVYNDLKAKSVAMPTYVDCGELEVWFKVGVGIIKNQGNFDLVGLVTKKYSDELLEYHIEP